MCHAGYVVTRKPQALNRVKQPGGAGRPSPGSWTCVGRERRIGISFPAAIDHSGVRGRDGEALEAVDSPQRTVQRNALQGGCCVRRMEKEV